MFGYLRIILAFMVLASHAQIMFFGLNTGVVAVVIFYILAGFVFSSLYYRVYASSPQPFYALCKNRVLRIYPLYAYALCVCAVFVWVSAYHEPVFRISAFLAHVLIVPLNYYMFFDWSILQNPKSELNHLVWSLGAELQAYVILAIAFAFPYMRALLFVLSLCVFVLAVGAWIDTDIYGYRLVLGVWFIFMLGAMIERILYASPMRLYGLILLVCMLCMMGFIAVQKWFHVIELQPYAREVLMGIVCGIPLVYSLGALALKFPLFKLPYNRFLGSLSYAIFLTHTPSIWILDSMGIANTASYSYVGLLFIVSVILGVIGIYGVERPLQRRFGDYKHS